MSDTNNPRAFSVSLTDPVPGGVFGHRGNILLAADGLDLEIDYAVRVIRIRATKSPDAMHCVPFEGASWRENPSKSKPKASK